MKKILSIVYPLVVVVLFVAFLVGFKHEITISMEERNDIVKYLAEEPEYVVVEAEEEVFEQKVESILTKDSTNENITKFTYKTMENIQVSLEALNEELWFELRDAVTDESIYVGLWSKGKQKEWDLTDYEEVYFHFGNTQRANLWINDKQINVSDLTPVHYVYIKFNSQQLTSSRVLELGS